MPVRLAALPRRYESGWNEGPGAAEGRVLCCLMKDMEGAYVILGLHFGGQTIPLIQQRTRPLSNRTPALEQRQRLCSRVA
jgi:hypothetical protein